MIRRALFACPIYRWFVVHRALQPPPLRYLALEAFHLAERGLLPAALLYGRYGARPQRHPVMVLPGLWGTDRSTAVLRGVLRMQGHPVRGWRLGRHQMWTPEDWQGLADRLERAHWLHREPVSLVGISAGGIVAREFARARPHLVRQVITVGSPFRFRRGDRNRMSAIIGRLRPDATPSQFELLPPEEQRPPLPVPVTSIYSRTDGLVDWRSCVEVPGERRENIEVWGSHLGLATNAAVLIALADRLACSPQDWRPFRVPSGAWALYPNRGPVAAGRRPSLSSRAA